MKIIIKLVYLYCKTVLSLKKALQSLSKRQVHELSMATSKAWTFCFFMWSGVYWFLSQQACIRCHVLVTISAWTISYRWISTSDIFSFCLVIPILMTSCNGRAEGSELFLTPGAPIFIKLCPDWLHKPSGHLLKAVVNLLVSIPTQWLMGYSRKNNSLPFLKTRAPVFTTA